MTEGGGLGGAFGALVAVLAGAHYSIEVAKSLYTKYTAARNRTTDLALARRILGVAGEHCYYRSDNTHPLYRTRGSLHPDNRDALTTLTQHQVACAANEGRLLVSDSVPGDYEQDLVLVGSPTGEGCSRIVFGYAARPDDPESLELVNPPVDLPYFWVLDKNRIDPKAMAARYVEKLGLVRRPNWRIESQLGRGGTYVPIAEPSEQGLLREDFLLVSRVRNYLTTRALDSGKAILTFGGTHGIGTKAIDLLFRDESVLAELGRELRGVEAYQALFRVGDIQHDRVGSRACKIEIVDIQPLSDTDQVWRTAHNAVKPMLDHWLNRPPARVRRH